jgi:uroporphyrinogen-III synthase
MLFCLNVDKIKGWIIKVLLTREVEANKKTRYFLKEKGWDVIEQPFLETEAIVFSQQQLQKAKTDIQNSEYLIVTSPNAVRYCPQFLLAAIFKKWQGVFVMGPATQQCVSAYVGDSW